MQSVRIREVFISRLYGLYNHRINLKDEGLTIIHGANGVGKTAVLRCLNYLFEWDIEALSRIPFRTISIALSDGSKISISRSARAEKNSNKNDMLNGALELSFFKDSNTHIETVFAIDPEMINFAETITKSQSWMLKVQHGLWRDNRTGKHVDALEVVQDYFPAKSKRKKTHSAFFERIRKALNVKLIDTHRLNQRSKEQSADFTVLECAADMLKQIKIVNAEYARRAQELDQTFPHRLIMNSNNSYGPDVVKERLLKLEKRQAQLSKIGLLATFGGQSFPSDVESLSNPKLEAISLFVQDSEAKLDAFNELAIRCTALLNLIDTKFKHKKLEVSKENGLSIIDSFGEIIPMDALSSGEQHELVITYELLFKTPANTLLLIDEPEISLHVGWQKSFIEDLMYISDIVGFEAVVATHSPFIVGEKYDMMVSLDDGVHGE
jgi:predicted ATP-dependent endonuclease of OLD family